MILLSSFLKCRISIFEISMIVIVEFSFRVNKELNAFSYMLSKYYSLNSFSFIFLFSSPVCLFHVTYINLKERS